MLKLPKGWTNPKIVRVREGVYTLAIMLDEPSTFTEDQRAKLDKIAIKYLEGKLGYKIQSIEQYEKSIKK